VHYDAKETRIGFVAGVGVEWAFWNNWSAFLEGDFYGFGHKDLFFTCHPVGSGECSGPFGPVSVKQDIVAVKFGINWRWNWGKAPAPVVAKY
jgi:outer membrane immunogenic protein